MASEPITRARAESAACRPRLSVVLALVPALALLLAGCGTSASSAASAKVLGATCKRIEAAVSDGPEPAAAPVGYAQAHAHTLRAIHTSDPGLAHAIARLASAYDAFYLSNGSH